MIILLWGLKLSIISDKGGKWPLPEGCKVKTDDIVKGNIIIQIAIAWNPGSQTNAEAKSVQGMCSIELYSILCCYSDYSNLHTKLKDVALSC